jgi:hypothetical protein
VGALVLDLLAADPDRARSASELAAALRGELDDVPEDAESTLAEFLDGLEAEGILEAVAR